MEKMTVLSTNRGDWPKIQDTVIAAGVEVRDEKMDHDEWKFTVTGLDGSLEKLHHQLQKRTPRQLKKKTPKTICGQIYTFYQLTCTIDGSPEKLERLLRNVGKKFRVDIKIGHLSENGRHITIEEDKKETLENIQAFLAERKITASIF